MTQVAREKLTVGIDDHRARQQNACAQRLVQLLDPLRSVHGVADRTVLVMRTRSDGGQCHGSPVNAKAREQPITRETLIELLSRITHLNQGAQQLLVSGRGTM